MEPSPVAVSAISSATDLAVGGAHACALLADQSVSCWGANAAGQLGDGTTTNRLTATKVADLEAITKVVAADAFSCAIQSDGKLSCWGNDDYGQLGDGTITPRSRAQKLIWSSNPPTDPGGAACGTCSSTRLPACPNPTTTPDAFGVTCCSADAPYFLCNGLTGCSAQPSCCSTTCACTHSCTGGGA